MLKCGWQSSCEWSYATCRATGSLLLSFSFEGKVWVSRKIGLYLLTDLCQPRTRNFRWWIHMWGSFRLWNACSMIYVQNTTFVVNKQIMGRTEWKPNKKLLEKVSTLLCAAVGTASNHCGLETCIVCGDPTVCSCWLSKSSTWVTSLYCVWRPYCVQL